MLAFLVGAGCVGKPEVAPVAPSSVSKAGVKPKTPFPATFIYGRNGAHHLLLEKFPERIVSLSPAITEILYAVKAEGQLVAVTSACDFPSEAKSKPNIGGYPHSVEKILSFKPDLVIGDSSLNKSTLEALEKLHTLVYYADSGNVEDLYGAISSLGSVTNHEAEGAKIATTLREELKPSKLSPGVKMPRVLMVYGANPIFTTGPGTVIDEVIRAAGGQNVVTSKVSGDRVTPEQVISFAPDVIVCSPELVAPLKALPGFAQGVPAIIKNRFYSGDNSSPLVRPGPRLGAAKRALHRFLYPGTP